MENSEKFRKIKGVIKHYDWGGKTFLPRLLNQSNQEEKPFAEYWLGGDLHGGTRFPFLLKVLDVERMLSIQVHPSKAGAEAGFEAEDAAGIPLDAPHRSFRDRLPKPELLSPLTPFYLLHGFRSLSEIRSLPDEVPELAPLGELFRQGLEEIYTQVMTMPQEQVESILRPLVSRLGPLYNAGQLPKDHADFWVARAAEGFGPEEMDRGIFSIYLMNLVQLAPGEALFQDAGTPHAYLEGRTMEIMLASDNVLRGGLTRKYINIPALLSHTRYDSTTPAVMKPQSDMQGERVFAAPENLFALGRMEIAAGSAISLVARSHEIIFLAEGHALVSADGDPTDLSAGSALLVHPGTALHYRFDRPGLLFRGFVPFLS